jgi:hypothetical protein
MPDRCSLLIRLALTAAAVLAIPPATASAALTSSSIDSPADDSFLTYDDTSGPTTVHVTGTANPPGSHVDVRCFISDNYRDLGSLSHDIATDATTGAFEADLEPPIGGVCRMRAVEAFKPSPDDLSPFTGPKIAVSGLDSRSVNGGPNAGVARDYYIASMLFAAGNDFNTLGSCGLCDSYLFDTSPDPVVTKVFNGNAWTPLTSLRGDEATLEVDGHPSYTPEGISEGGVFFTGFEDLGPYPLLGYSYHIDPATHDLTIHETDHLVRCKPDAETFPPTETSCTSFADAGVKLDRTIVADHGQRLVRIHDRWSSTDGHPHLFTTQYRNDHCLDNGACEQAGFRFPGDSAYSVRPAGQTRSGPFPAPGSIFVKDPGGHTTAQGATVYSVAPDDAYFYPAGYLLDYLDRSVPATGSLDLRFGYATTLTTTAVTGFARQLEDQYAAPRVTIASPVNGASTANPSVLVKGRATDTVGVTSFKLNGRPLALGPAGGFSKRVKLRAGRNTLTAVARDAAGNIGRADSTIVEFLARTRKAGAKRRDGAVVVDSGKALACPAPGAACTATLKATAKPGKVGKATVQAAAGKRRELKFRLNEKGERALVEQKQLKITLKIDVRRGKVVHVTTTRSFDLKRPAG